MLELRSIKKDYITASETVHALRGVDITFRDREFVSVLGPSGCGKTTLLNIIGGLDRYTSGDLVINGRSTKSYSDRDWDVYRNHRVGFIFQSYNLIPHQTILGNVELALTIAGIDKEERTRRAKAALDKVGLSSQYYKRPNQLSGGQCQRVAIARALVNEPEILLADEPTGALDTVTSVQIMELIREIAGERLVIMVTHNPELAAQYSTRIISLLDGNVKEDTNPVGEDEYAARKAEETRLIEEEKKEEERLTKEELRQKEKKKEKAKMSVFTAFRLSARNLISKKGRTSLVGVAGSIGIIGIALVLAFSAGIKGYIASMQDDMLSGHPVSISESTYDLSALTDMMNSSFSNGELEKIPGHVYVSYLVEYIAKMGETRKDAAVKNVITEEYISYIKAMPKEFYKAMTFNYGFNLNPNIYTNFKTTVEDAGAMMSISAITSMYTSILEETEFKDYAKMVDALAPNFAQIPNNPEYILTQYDLVGEGSRMATEAGEIMLVLNSEDELSDLLLARFGFFTQDEFFESVNKAVTKDENGNPVYNEALYREYFTYDELLGKTFVWYPNDTVFSLDESVGTFGEVTYTNPTHIAYSGNFAEGKESTGLELKVVGILTPKESVNFGLLSSGIYYTEALAEHILENNAGSKIIDYISNINGSSITDMLYSYIIPFTYEYSYNGGEVKTGSGSITPKTTSSDMMSSLVSIMGSMGGSSSQIDHTDMKEKFIRNLGGNPLANGVQIYPVSFDDKDLVTSYLDAWNADAPITVDGTVYEKSERDSVNYTDNLELVISMINTMIDIVSYALIAFTSVSLVVSTVMIGIITYVSVVERIKEIGVIRSLGGRKRDVSNLFIAETFIIGLLAGIIGIAATYLISAIVSLCLEPLINYANIALLPWDNALLLIALSVFLTLISGLAPAASAANKDPVVALRTE